MAPVTYLDDHRTAPAYTGLTCPCGAAWFALRQPHHGAFDGPGTVCLDTEGRVTGYTGHPVCVECGTPAKLEWSPL